MTGPLRNRIAVFSIAIILLVAVLAWSVSTAWLELGTLRRRLTTAEFDSFRIAGELQSQVRDVNSALLSYALTGKDADWRTFEAQGAKLNAWLDVQRENIRTKDERRVLGEIDAEYDRYLDIAAAVRKESRDPSSDAAARVHQVDQAPVHLFSLAGVLADAHHGVLGDLLAQSQGSLRKLELIFCAGLALILVLGSWGTRLVFHETITPLRRQLIEVQELAARREKLASLGVLAAGVAHEIRNPLTALKTRSFVLRKKVEPNAPALADALLIDKEIDRLERIVSDFLLFAKPSDPAPESIAPIAFLSEVRQLLAPALATNEIELVVESGGTVPNIYADSNQLKQVLINLIRNAADSVERRGRIELRARRDRVSLRGLFQNVVVLEVRDSGKGIPPEVQSRLFDPFFTTKSAGTGLGLSIAMRIVEQNGGTLQLETAVGAGTTFGVVLPVGLHDAPPVVGAELNHAEV